MIRASSTCFSTNLQLFKVMHCIYCTLDSQLGFPPYQIVFTGVANTSSTPIAWECEGQVGSHKVAGKGYIFTKNSQMSSIGAIFTSTCHTKQLNAWSNAWSNSLASHVVIHGQLSACQGKMGPFKGQPSTHGRQTGLRNRPK